MDYTNQSKKNQIEAIEQLNVHDHICSIYETREEQFSVIIPFIKIGLDRGEKCVYIVEENTAQEVLNAMEKEGIDTDSSIKSGSLRIFNKQDTYLKQGYFDPDLMIQFLKEAVDSAKEEGYKALRGTGEMTWILNGDPGVERLMEYESKLNSFFSENDIVAICQYNHRHFTPEIILNVVRTHPIVIYGSLVCKNFYYVPPVEFLKPEQTSLEVDRLLSNICAREQNELELKESKDVLQKLTSSTLDSIIMIDDKGEIAFWNKAAEKMFGYHKEEAIGKDLHKLIVPKRFYADYSKGLEAFKREGTGAIIDQTISLHALKKDGTEFVADHSFSSVKINGKWHAISIVRDITERKLAEKRLRDSEKKNRAWLENSPVCTKIVDLDFNLLYMSDAGVKSLKFDDVTQYYGKPYPFDFYPESFRNLMTENLEKVKKTGEIITQEASMVDIEGNEMWFHSTLVPVNDDENRIDYIMVVSMDITDRKKVEEKYRNLINTAQDALMVNIDGVVSEWNMSAENIFGYSRDEIIGQSVSVLVPDEHKKAHLAGLDRFIKTGDAGIIGKTVEAVGLTKEGVEVPIEMSLSYQRLEKEQHQFTAIIRDITERKQSERRLNAQHEVTKVLAESNTVKEASPRILNAICEALDWDVGEIWEYDRIQNALYNTEIWHASSLKFPKFKATTKQITFSPKTGLPGRVWESAGPLWIEDVVHDTDFLRAAVADKEELHGAFGFPIIVGREVLGTICFFSRKIRKPDKGLLDMMAAIGCQIGLFIKRKQADEKLRKLSHAIEQSSSSVIITNAEGNVEYANPKYVQLTGYSAEETIGANPRILKSGKIPPEVYKELWNTITSGNEWKGELCNRKKNGELYWEAVSISPVKNDEDVITSFIAIKDDITERKKMEEALLQSEKLKSIGTITAGIAHDFNNVLAIISGITQLLEVVHCDNRELTKELKIITEAAHDGAEISSKMLKVSKTGQSTKNFVSSDIRDLVMKAIDFIKPRWKNEAQAKGINYHFDKEGIKSVLPIMCNSTEIKEVFINIINNALDAMPEGGTLSFSTWSVDNTVFASISDTGEGMLADVKKNVFDPFFSTKGVAGTGLGLSMAYGIVIRHGGKIEVESSMGKGTTFTLQFPATNKRRNQIEAPVPELETSGKNLRILVVDDEEAIRHVLDKFLTRSGHKVKTVDNGADAIGIAKAEDIDLVLCDLVIPDVFGIDVIKAINRLERNPRIGIISGWSEKPGTVEGGELQVDFFLSKPFKLSKLKECINDLGI